MPQAQQPPDLEMNSNIETEVVASWMQHVLYRSGHSLLGRHVRREERWVREAVLGHGTYDTVHQQRCEGEKQKLRAVKEIKKYFVASGELGYTSELKDIVKFLHPKVGYSIILVLTKEPDWFVKIVDFDLSK
ncbi:hypothetical protein EG329_004655 [Mollisiaceae sp. DMI_Dod_QoI]|nr:hypothetical protein EG329_004655 [Helotiales sp. DMI_Dod_QoI]